VKVFIEKSGNKQINNEDSRQFDQNEDDYDDDLDMIPRRKIKKEADYNDDDDLDVPRPKRVQAVDDDDDDLDVPRPKRVQDVDDNDDLDMIRRKRSTNNDGDLSPVRRRKQSIEDDVDVTKVRQRKTTKEEEYKKAKKEEKLLKYMEWGKGLVQKKERDEKLAEAVYEADKPLARYKDDKDLERLLKEQEREGFFI
jgi:pre-mRNA-splicing factor CWC26